MLVQWILSVSITSADTAIIKVETQNLYYKHDFFSVKHELLRAFWHFFYSPRHFHVPFAVYIFG